MLEYYKSLFLRPHTKLDEELQKASLGRAFLNIFAAATIQSIILSVAFFAGAFPPIFLTIYRIIGLGLEPPVSMIVATYTSLVFTPLNVGLLLLLAKLFGGKGSFKSLLYGNSLILVPVSLFSLLLLVPVVGYAFFAALSSMLGLYVIYFTAVVLKRTQNMSRKNIVISFVIYYAIVSIILFIVGVAFLATFFVPSGQPFVVQEQKGNLTHYANSATGLSFDYPSNWEREKDSDNIPLFNSNILGFGLASFKVQEQEKTAALAVAKIPFIDESFSRQKIVSCNKQEMQDIFYSSRSSYDGGEINSTEYRQIAGKDYCFMQTTNKRYPYAGIESHLTVIGLCKDNSNFWVTAIGFDSLELKAQLDEFLASSSC